MFDAFLSLMAYYEEYNLETYEFEYPHFLASKAYAAGDKTGMAGSKDVYEFTKDYVAPEALALREYEEGEILRRRPRPPTRPGSLTRKKTTMWATTWPTTTATMW